MTATWAGARVLFTGDSVTDCGRRDDPAGLGDGYVRVLADGPLRTARVTNTGVGGNRLDDLAARWDTDVLAHEPDVLSVLIGINDTWRWFDSGLRSPVGLFEQTYRDLLGRTAAQFPGLHLVLVEPFVLPVRPDQERWWPEDLAARVDAVHRLATDHGAVLVPAGTHLAALATRTPHDGAAALAPDGVHPTAVGHRELADLWWRTVSSALPLRT